MNLLRGIVTVLIAPICLLAHDVLVASWERYSKVPRHDMLGYGIHIYITGWAFVILLPLCIFFGNMWWNNSRRYLPHIALLVALVFWSLNVRAIHPSRSLLFLMCCWATLPMRWVIDRTVSRAISR